MTIEELKKEKDAFKKEVEKSLKRFYEATGMTLCGDFRSVVFDPLTPGEEPRVAPIVTVKPIEI